MSRVGKRLIEIPQNVKVNVANNRVNIEGPQGKSSFELRRNILVKVDGSNIEVTRQSDKKEERAMHGTTRALINNIIIGLTDGFQKDLEIQGVGYKAAVQGKTLVLNLGFSHPINYPIPSDITIETPKPTNIIVKGVDKQRVGLVASQIRQYRKPEPYKGKGIRYVGEYVRRKAGKAIGK